MGSFFFKWLKANLAMLKNVRYNECLFSDMISYMKYLLKRNQYHSSVLKFSVWVNNCRYVKRLLMRRGTSIISYFAVCAWTWKHFNWMSLLVNILYECLYWETISCEQSDVETVKTRKSHRKKLRKVSLPNYQFIYVSYLMGAKRKLNFPLNSNILDSILYCFSKKLFFACFTRK